MLRPVDADDDRPIVRFAFEERTLEARQGDSVAAALLAAGVGPLRTSPTSGSPRAPYCMMGVCFECLVEVDGMADCQACMTKVAPGMCVRRNPTPAAGHES